MSRFIADIHKAERLVSRERRAYRATLSRVRAAHELAAEMGFSSEAQKAWYTTWCVAELAGRALNDAEIELRGARFKAVQRVNSIHLKLYTHGAGLEALSDEDTVALVAERDMLTDICTGWAEDE